MRTGLKDLWDLDPEVAHLNHGSYGAVPRPVQEAQGAWRRRAEANPMQFFARDIDTLIDEARSSVAATLRCDDEGFAFVPNVTAAANVIVASLNLRPGDHMIITDHAYGAVRMTLEEGARRSGARVEVVHVPLGATDTGERVINAVTEETRLVVIDHITSPTATIMPVEELTRELRARGVSVFVDAAHAPGMIDVDVGSLGADFWAANFHKWVCAPRASGGMWVSPEHRDAIRPLVTSWRASEGYPGSFGWWGTQDFSPYLTVPDAFDWLGGLGADVLQQNHDLVMAGTSMVREAIDQPPIEGRGPEQIGWMDLVPMPDGVATTTQAARALSSRVSQELKVEVPVVAWNGRGLMRLSAHAYNTIDDFERLAAGISRTLR